MGMVYMLLLFLAAGVYYYGSELCHAIDDSCKRSSSACSPRSALWS
jgi:hypothetical protein